MREGISAAGNADFDDFLDGALQPPTLDVDNTDGLLSKLYVTNHPSGLPAGTYGFHGVWTKTGA